MAEVQRDNSGSREDTLRFIDLVGLFGSQAMMALGKVMNPATNKAEKNLAAARLFIDMLDMLERKTAGNLSGDEGKILKATLTDLRLMYAEEAKGGAPSSAESKAPDAEETASAADAPTVPSPENPAPAATDESKVKFRKKYD